MAWRRLTAASGQTQGEFALIVGGVAIVCIVAVLFLGGAVGDLWDRSSKPVPGGLYPPDSPSSTVEPTSMADCEGDGWQSFPQFATQQACFDFVAGITPEPE
jgi:Flp pilus assembly pilin Flp